MHESGLAGAMGGVHVTLISGGTQELLLPMPQLVDGQVPLCFFVGVNPPEALTDLRLCRLEDSNTVMRVDLVGKDRDVQINWSSVVVLAKNNVTPNTTKPDPYRAATPCVEAQADAIVKLASETSRNTTGAGALARNIQAHIRGLQRKAQPNSLDALAILESGENSICTANANLAAAVMRSKGIACRSIAVIPTISQRLEMHRVVEFYENNRWISSDPSSLLPGTPIKPCKAIIMAKTTIADEKLAMEPRMGSMAGVPYGQETELLTSGVTLSGQDFLWSQAKPLAEFEPSESAIRLAADAWNRYLAHGTLTPGQLKAASARTVAGLAEALDDSTTKTR
jgi:hypothetical protein